MARSSASPCSATTTLPAPTASSAAPPSASTRASVGEGEGEVVVGEGEGEVVVGEGEGEVVGEGEGEVVVGEGEGEVVAPCLGCIVADPGVHDGFWTASGTASLNDGEGARIDFDCGEVDAVLRSTAAMPDFDGAGRALTVVGHLDCLGGVCGFGQVPSVPARLRVGSFWQDSPLSLTASESTFESRVCLPPAAYDGASPLSVAFAGFSCDASGADLVIDKVDVVDDPGCVAIDFVDDISAWTATGDVSISGPTAALALRHCESVSLSRSFVWAPRTRISVSTRVVIDSADTPALSVQPAATIGTAAVTLAPGTATTSLCVPPGLVGTTAPVSLSAFASGTCDDALVGHLFVDAFSVTSDPLCDDDPAFAGSDFGPAGTALSPSPSWLLSSGSPAHRATIFASDVDSELRLRAEGSCLSASALTWALAPTTPGVALRWSSLRPGSSINSLTQIVVRGPTQNAVLPLPSVGGSTQSVCLGDDVRGATVEVAFVLNGGPGICDGLASYAAEDIFVDDVAFVADPACAAP